MTLDPWHVLTANFGEFPKPYTAFATLLDMVLYFIVILNVGRARFKYKVEAPSTDGPPTFQRIFRVQMNTLEQLVAFVPALWLFAVFLSPAWASTLGTVWIIGRVFYAIGYYRAAEKRGAGFVIAFGAFAILWLGALWGAIRVLLQG